MLGQRPSPSRYNNVVVFLLPTLSGGRKIIVSTISDLRKAAASGHAEGVLIVLRRRG